MQGPKYTQHGGELPGSNGQMLQMAEDRPFCCCRKGMREVKAQENDSASLSWITS